MIYLKEALTIALFSSRSDSWYKGDSIDSVQTIDQEIKHRKPLWPLGELQINVGRFCCKCTCYDLFNMASGLASQLEFLFFLKLYSLFLSVNWLSVDRNSSKQRERESENVFKGKPLILWASERERECTNCTSKWLWPNIALKTSSLFLN